MKPLSSGRKRFVRGASQEDRFIIGIMSFAQRRYCGYAISMIVSDYEVENLESLRVRPSR